MKPWQSLAIAAAVLIAFAVWYCASTYDLFGGPPRPDEIIGATGAAPVVDPLLKTNHDPTPLKPSGAPSPTAAQPSPAPTPNAPSAPSAAPPVAQIPSTESSARPVAAAMDDAGTRYALDRQGIRAAVTSAIPEMKECYESWHRLDPSLEGRMVVSFVLTSDGGEEANVDQVHVKEDAGIGHVAFEGCVLSVVSSMRFDAPQGGGNLTVNYPLMFASADPDAGT